MFEYFDYQAYLHNKTGKVYIAVRLVTNATNENDGQRMVLYTRDGEFYVREASEFLDKFKKVTNYVVFNHGDYWVD